jgi:hypothetical protein
MIVFIADMYIFPFGIPSAKGTSIGKKGIQNMSKEAIAKRIVQEFYQLLFKNNPQGCSMSTEIDQTTIKEVPTKQPGTPGSTKKESSS